MKTITTLRSAAATAALGAVLSGGLAAQPAHAAPSHWNTDPYLTGCAKSSFTLASRGVPGGTASVKVSRTCGTNWIEYSGGKQTTSKTIKDHATGRWTRTEIDNAGWSYSMQVYAPGTTAVSATIKVGSSTTTATCSYGCTWQISTPVPSASTKISRVVAWARAQVGSSAYPGLCERFVENAWGTSGRYASAKAAYNAFRAAGRISTSRTNIPAGAIVFSSNPAYDRGYGHVMLSVGGGQFVSGGAGTPSVKVYTTPNPGSTFLGWVVPSEWPGR